MIAILFALPGASSGTPTDPELRGELVRMKNVDESGRDFSMVIESGERVLLAVDAVHTPSVANEQLGFCARRGRGRGEACFSEVDLESPKQFKWASVVSQRLLAGKQSQRKARHAFVWQGEAIKKAPRERSFLRWRSRSQFSISHP
ncbi:hypothetical protein D7Y38_02620 [Stenotrophomonas maltophilia]|nr:hypothetical protein [Stenotrophomonas maltophilia]